GHHEPGGRGDAVHGVHGAAQFVHLVHRVVAGPRRRVAGLSDDARPRLRVRHERAAAAAADAAATRPPDDDGNGSNLARDGLTIFLRRSAMDTLQHLRSWIGRSEQRTDTITAAPLAALAAALDRDDPAPATGTAVPPLWHWLYFLPIARQSELGPDGHPRRGGFLPPVELPRRMWAGGRLTFERPLRVGEVATRTSRIDDVTAKDARSGPLVFVTVHHALSTPEGHAISEAHDIVYRGLPAPGSAATPQRAPTDETFARTVVP